MEFKQAPAVGKAAGFGGSIRGLFVFLLIAVFAIFSLMLVLIGAGAYRNVVDSATENAGLRTSLNYIASKVRSADGSGAVAVDQRGEVPALLLNEVTEDRLYQTRIYYLRDEEGGALYELYTKADNMPELSSGERIADIAGFDVRAENDCVYLHIVLPDGSEQSLRLRLHSRTARLPARGGRGRAMYACR